MNIFNLFKRKRNWANFDAFIGQETSSGIKLTDDKIMGIPAVFACVRVLSESIASLPLITYQRMAGDDKRRAKDFSLYSILHDSPNPLMTAFELREMMVGHLALRGNAYCFIEREDGTIVALWPLNPKNIKVEIQGRDLIYIHQSDGDEKKYQSEDILHIRGLSSDGIIGYSPLTMLRDTFGAAKAVGNYADNYFKNDASPGGILTTDQDLGDNAEDLRNAWNKGFRGSGNKHKVAILGGGLRWESVGISPQDSQMIESQKFSVIQIARIFRVPLNLIMDYDRSTYSNVTEQNRSFLVHTLTPWLERIEQAIFRSLLTEQEKMRYFVEHLTHNFLRGDTKERYEAYQIARQTGFLSVNEIRKFENMNSVEGGDSYETPQVQVTQQKALREQKELRGIDRRDRIAENFRPLILDAASQIVRRESLQIKKRIQKEKRYAENESFRTWLENFYEQIMPEVIDLKMSPVLKSYAQEIQQASELEVGAKKFDMEEFINKHAETYRIGHIASSQNQLLDQLEKSGLDAVEKRADDWMTDEHRANKITNDQVVKTASLVFAEVAFLGGYKIMSNTRGKSCPWCQSLNGKIVGRGQPMLKAGDWESTKGELMTVRRPKISPAYHRGCDCFLTHV